jgi:hypothetical protein
VWIGSFGEAFQLALRAGILIDGRVQIEADVSPVTTVMLNVATQAIPMFEAVGTIGYLAEISPEISWIIRVGGGGGMLLNPLEFSSQNLSFGEIRLDFFGAAIRASRHVQVEVNTPSFRIMLFPNTFNTYMLQWVTNVTINYVF